MGQLGSHLEQPLEHFQQGVVAGAVDHSEALGDGDEVNHLGSTGDD